jgi:hypothetical protein
MIYHILNGDALAKKFDLDGEIIICREILIEGDLQAENLEDFWRFRAEFIKKAYADDTYLETVKSEFTKLNHLNPGDEVNFWFGNEAFCQVNMWFCSSLVLDKNAEFYRVFPDSNDWSCDFDQLENRFESRQRLTADDLQLGNQLWQAFCSRDFERLKYLSEIASPCIIRLNEVCHALIEKDWKPKEILSEITNSGENDFGKIVIQFQEKAGIYGFGDLQIKHSLEFGHH